MNFKHCTQDEIYPTRYLVLQVIDIAKPHCHLSSEAESLWGFFALSYVVHIIKEISFQVLFVVVSIRSIPFFAGGFGSNLYLYSKWNMAAETNFCLKLLLLRCCFTVKTKFYACKLHKQHIWGTNDEPFFKLPFLLLLKPSLLWLMRLKSDGWLTICELTVPDWIFLTDVACFIFRPFFLGVHCKHLFIWIFRCVMCNFDTWVELHDSGKTCMSWLI